jgi:hypothetical protein
MPDVLALVLPDDPRPDQPNVLHALIRKRAEIAGLIEDARDDLRRLHVDLDHVECTIQLFQPAADVTAIKPKRQQLPPLAAGKGEMTRLVLRQLRDAEAPMTANEIADAVLEARGLNPDDEEARSLTLKRTRACLQMHRRQGITRSVRGDGHLQGWELASPRVGRATTP